MDQQQQRIYGEQVQARLRAINQAVTNASQFQRSSFNRDTRMEQLMDVVYQRLSLLENYITMYSFTQKRINVIEQYLQEIEVLLNLDQ